MYFGFNFRKIMKLSFLKALFIGSCTLWGMSQQILAEERVVASINGQPIMQSEVKRALGKKADNAANRKVALESLIDDILVQKAIKDAGITVNYAYIDQMIEGIAAQNGLTYGQLLDALDYEGISLAQYRQQLAHQLVMQQVRDITIGNAIQVEPQEVQQLAKKMLADAKAKGKVETLSGTEYRISHILIKTTPILNDVQAKSQLNKIVSDIKAGKTSFEDAAKKYSVDYASGADGGDLGWNRLGVYDQTFASVAKNSKKTVISAPFKSQFGWHILKVTDTRQGDMTEENYLEKAYQQLVNQRAQAVAKDWVKALRQQADIRYLN